MLVLSRKIEEGVRIGDTIEIKILDVFTTDDSGRRSAKVASIGIEAPREVNILRGELVGTSRANKAAEESVRDLSPSELAGLIRRKRALPDLEK